MNHQQILRAVNWQDLRKLSTSELLIENNLTIPWFVIANTFAWFEHYLIALPFSAFFFLAALRQVHNGFHNALGTNRFLTWFTLYSNSVLMFVSVHAVRFNHLRHHKYCLQEQDYEGKSARMRWYTAILYGPVHLFLIHRVTWIHGNRKHRRNMLLELFSIGIFLSLIVYFQVHVLLYHAAVMLLAECLMAFFAVWTVHHDTHENPLIARTQRKSWKNRLTLNMFYHLEHHLFPAVPTIKLPELARRIDAMLPELEKKSTF